MQTTMDLSGLWEVRLGDGAPATVHLPGTLEENGLGEPETPALESRLTRRFRWEGEAVRYAPTAAARTYFPVA